MSGSVSRYLTMRNRTDCPADRMKTEMQKVIDDSSENDNKNHSGGNVIR